jgi:hypothetical protein
MAAPGYRPSVDSDVLIGQHHGGDNATSTCFVRAVTPQFVVFSAGHAYHHPQQASVDRLTDTHLAHPVAIANILRTDRGDNEGDGEMTAGSGSCADAPGDDDVEIRLPLNPALGVDVHYRGPSRPCV